MKNELLILRQQIPALIVQAILYSFGVIALFHQIGANFSSSNFYSGVTGWYLGSGVRQIMIGHILPLAFMGFFAGFLIASNYFSALFNYTYLTTKYPTRKDIEAGHAKKILIGLVGTEGLIIFLVSCYFLYNLFT